MKKTNWRNFKLTNKVEQYQDKKNKKCGTVALGGEKLIFFATSE